MEEIKTKPTGYDLSELALLYGQRGCCKKGTCIHKKAQFAVNRIKELEDALKGVFNSVEYFKYVYKDSYIFDEYDSCMKPLWQKADSVLKNNVELKSKK